jgi:hypothetical protein
LRIIEQKEKGAKKQCERKEIMAYIQKKMKKRRAAES